MFERILKGTPAEQQAQSTLDKLSRKSSLSKADRLVKQEALSLRRSLHLRRAGYGTALLAAVGVLTLTLIGNPLSLLSPGEWLTIQNQDSFGRENVGIMAKAAQDWDTRHLCGRRVTIRYNPTLEVINLPGGVVDVTEEQSDPGIIEIGVIKDLRDNILHAMTHACQPDQPTPVIPFKLPDGIMVTGYQGAKIKATLDDGTGTTFTKIEEGIAERNASIFPGYQIKHPSYFEVGIRARRDFPVDRYPKFQELIKNNDVPAIVRISLTLAPDHQMTPQDLWSVMQSYQLAWGSNP